ncbi:hypothetical protein [Paraburkholderia sp. GAS348]|uniref:hypothetical protein n=1 Tax=Paraburkholderia sp. GAS348 TaxID=3035132 RepID=UPI003D1BCE20
MNNDSDRMRGSWGKRDLRPLSAFADDELSAIQHPWPSGEAAWDERGDQVELIRFEDVVPHHWSDSTFDRRNPEYGLHGRRA